MAKIEKLSPHLADLIAAGEVVERPASVVKELVENAIDARAAAVTVELVRGGMEEICVTDDGCGMSREDARRAFLRHATSKLSTPEQLAAIGTLGFRGEALAAICAVSRVELTTCERGADTGSFLYLEGGEIREDEEVGCPEGTVMRVRDLFYNTPARLKFVKKDAAEGAWAASVAEKCAMSHPEVAVTLIREGTEIFRTPGDGKLYSVLYAIYGAEFARGLLEVDYTYGAVRARGYVTAPEKARGNRSLQNFFVNGRPVKNRILSVAVEEACRGSVMVGRFPSCFMDLRVDPAAVDVNVHPTKSEVKFSAEKDVFDSLYFGVKNALMRPTARTEAPAVFAHPPAAQPQSLSGAAQMAEPPAAGQERPASADAPQPPPVRVPQRESATTVFSQPMAVSYAVRPAPAPAPVPAPVPAPAPAPSPAPAPADAPQHFVQGEYRIIGELARLYVLVEYEEALVVVDKHAVHERMIYERLRREEPGRDAQLLLKPVVINLSGEDMALYEENAPLLAAAGFETEVFGEMSIAVRQVPLGLEREDVVPLVTDMLRAAASRRDALEERRDRVLHTLACRAALKAGDRNALPELSVLVRHALFDPAIRYCPHGRPVKWTLDKKELEKRFGRSGNLS